MKLKINKGLTKAQIKQLISFSNEDGLILKTTNDNIRFKNNQAFKNWLKKKRTAYSLSDEKNNLLGVIWFGIELIPTKDADYNTTFAIRLYDKARGKGNALPFMKGALNKYIKSQEYKNNSGKGFWLITNSYNLPAISVYGKFGFKKDKKFNEEGKILMKYFPKSQS